jgi:hypothetical protein
MFDLWVDSASAVAQLVIRLSAISCNENLQFGTVCASANYHSRKFCSGLVNMIGHRRNNEISRISKGGFRWILDDMWSALQGEMYQWLVLLIYVDESECSHCVGYTSCHFGPASTVTHGAQNR